MKKLLTTVITGTSLIFPVMGEVVYADAAHDSGQYVSRAQYEQLKNEMEKMKKQIQFLVRERSKRAPQQHTTTNKDVAELRQQVKTLKKQTEAQKDGTTGFLLTGYGFAGYTDSERSGSSFNAGFNPIFLWRLREDLIFEGEMELELEDGSTEVGLEYAQLSYLFNDYITIGVGKFLNPSNYFIERLHPAWINKLPDKPITMGGNNRIQASSQLGAQIRGGVPLGLTRGEYAFYVSNGPSMRADGSLSFKDFPDGNDSKAVGGHIAWWPFAGFEVGYGFEVAGVNDPSGGHTLDVITHAVDMNYLKTSKYLLGTVDLRFQYADRQVDRSSSPMLAFDNASSGGYAQIAYRPGMSGVPVVKDMESIFRFDWIDLPNAANFHNEKRWTVGLNYYLAVSTLFKFAYQFDKKQGYLNDNAVLFQVATGF